MKTYRVASEGTPFAVGSLVRGEPYDTAFVMVAELVVGEAVYDHPSAARMVLTDPSFAYTGCLVEVSNVEDV